RREGEGREQRAGKRSARALAEDEDLEEGIPEKLEDGVLVCGLVEQSRERLPGDVALGAEMQDLESRLAPGIGERGEVDVGGHVLGAGRRVGIVGPGHVVLPLAVDAKRKVAAARALNEAPGRLAVVDGDDGAGTKRGAELADE